MKFTMITKTEQYDSIILDNLKGLLGFGMNVVEDEYYYVIYHTYTENVDINKLLEGISIELFVKISSYTSYDQNDYNLGKELNIASYLLDKLPMGHYSLKTALQVCKNIENKSFILDYILDGTGVDQNLIKAMAVSDLNTSKASKLSYLHRNTLLYKLDKLKKEKDFDLRVFLDEYILYSLID